MDSIADGVKGRFSNPFWGSYIFSFTAYNWDMAVFVFSGNETASSRIENVQRVIEIEGLCKITLIPLVFSVSVLFLTPILMWAVDFYNNLINIKRLKSLEKQNLDQLSTWKNRFQLTRSLLQELEDNAANAMQNNAYSKQNYEKTYKITEILKQDRNEIFLEKLRDYKVQR